MTLQRVALSLLARLPATGSCSATGSVELLTGSGIQSVPGLAVVGGPGILVCSGGLDPLHRASRGLAI